METYLSLLRGINIGGNNIIHMADLRKLYDDLGFTNIDIYKQSGNLIFGAKPDKNLNSIIENKIFENLNLRITVIIRKVEEIRKTIEGNPFSEGQLFDTEKLCVAFLNRKPLRDKIKQLCEINYKPEEFLITGNVIYVYCKNGFGKTKLNTNFFESKLDIRATTRSWKTVNELYKLLSNR